MLARTQKKPFVEILFFYKLLSFIRTVNDKNENEEITSTDINLVRSGYNITGLFYAKRFTITKEKEKENENDEDRTLFDYDNINRYLEQNNKIRSCTDVASLNSSVTSSTQHDHCSIAFNNEQINKQEKKRANEDDGNDDDNDDGDDDNNDNYIVVQQRSMEQLTMINSENEIKTEEYDFDDKHFESIKLFDNGQHEGMLSDDSEYLSENLRLVF